MDNGKKAEQKLKTWLNRPEEGYSFDRIPDQLGGLYGGRNISDFVLFKAPYQYYIESKETENDRFDFSRLTDFQREGLKFKSSIQNVYGLVVVLFTTYKRAFILDIRDILKEEEQGNKSINIKKIDKWTIPYAEIKTIPSRKFMLDYTGEIEDYLKLL